MRKLDICKNCKSCSITLQTTYEYDWKMYQCKFVVRDDNDRPIFRVDVIKHTEKEFELLPLYEGCPYYMEHIVMLEGRQCEV